jgi:NADH-quinone oxidoreductase subunit N
MYLIAGSTSLVSIFIGLELMSIPSSFIILLSRRESLEAATKYFVMASVAIALLSFAVVLVYGSTNSLALQLPQQQPSTLMSFAFILFVAALGFEASLFPFNVLLPDVYQGSSAYATAMLGGLNKKAGFAALLQIFILIFITFHFAFIAIALLSVLTMFYGNLGALVQENFKRMLAYSSISQAGYILMGIAVADQAGIGASLVQIFAHVFLFIGIMGIVAWLESRERNEINDLIGLYKENRLCAIALTFFMLALAGVPFTTGFVGKFLIFLSAVSAGLVWLALLGIINSIISVFYYAKAITAIYTNKLGAYRMRLDRPTLIVVLVCAALTLLFGIYPQPLIQMTSNAAGYLFASI